MSLASELKGSRAAAELTYTLVFPPGWAEYGIDREAEAQLVQNARDLYRDGGRPDIALDVRTRIHVYFARVRKIGATAMYLPIKRVDDIVLPVSIVAVPFRAAPGTTLVSAVDRLAGGRAEAVQLPQGPAWRWQEERNRVDGEEGLSSLLIHYLVPAPGERPGTGLVLSYAILHLTGDEGDEFVTVLAGLFEPIAGTFRWKQN
ncbi:hypothetical protein [Cryobacterium shii]|uniref:Uncharacterized protein n=1 Tax=Cryobacterium shii TaxID=1259235 RepID=A0AAQ2HES5_9MICO|nr:hypothetical protein [Cryobacterium shii]TFC43422.1 hypothetical protein E3O49_13255 [Cryobacterium shii]